MKVSFYRGCVSGRALAPLVSMDVYIRIMANETVFWKNNCIFYTHMLLFEKERDSGESTEYFIILRCNYIPINVAA